MSDNSFVSTSTILHVGQLTADSFIFCILQSIHAFYPINSVLTYCSQFCSHLLLSILFSFIILNSVLISYSQFRSHLLFSILFSPVLEKGFIVRVLRTFRLICGMRRIQRNVHCRLGKEKKTNEKETGQNIVEIKLFGTI